MQGNARALIDLARKETDLSMKKEIVGKLSLMGSKEATEYMMELLNKRGCDLPHHLFIGANRMRLIGSWREGRLTGDRNKTAAYPSYPFHLVNYEEKQQVKMWLIGQTEIDTANETIDYPPSLFSV